MSLGLIFVLLCALAPVNADKDTRRCPEGFLEYRSSCYWFSSITGSFAEATSYCQFFGSHLARITSQDENNFIRSQVNITENDSPSYWLGATDLMKEGKFMWEGGCPLHHGNWTPWSSNEPNNKWHQREKGEHCVSLSTYKDSKWNDRECCSEIYFICERKVSTRDYNK